MRSKIVPVILLAIVIILGAIGLCAIGAGVAKEEGIKQHRKNLEQYKTELQIQWYERELGIKK